MQEMIHAVQSMAIDLGRTPLRKEFEAQTKGAKWSIDAKFGNYAALLHAAGLDPIISRQTTNDIFKRDLVEVLSEYRPREVKPQVAYSPTVIIGDTHFPFVSQRVLDAIYEFIEKEKPARIIQIGDLYDMYSHSKFPRSYNIYTPDQEEDLAIEGAAKMWQTILSIVPKAECVQLKGNHDVRPVKRTIEVQPPLERAVNRHLNAIMSFDGVKLIEDPRQEYIAEGVMYHHGYRSQLGSHRDYNLMNFVCGHSHKGGVSYRRFNGQTFWELNAGLVGDPESKVQSYTAQKNHDCTAGLGFIDCYGPRFVHL